MNNKQQKKDTLLGYYIIAGLLVTIVLFMVIIGNRNNGPVDLKVNAKIDTTAIRDSIISASSAYIPYRETAKIDDAWYATKELVKLQLKSPTSAEFNDDKIKYTSSGDTLWVITASVDAQNSFGAQLRKTFQATVYYGGGDVDNIHNFHLLSLQFED